MNENKFWIAVNVLICITVIACVGIMASCETKVARLGGKTFTPKAL